jgi:protein-tyrosine phosphatase
MPAQPLNSFRIGFLNFINRLQTQGLEVTLIWMYARGLPNLTGIPVMKYSRITPELYVGPQILQAGKRRLEALGVTGSINMQDEFDDRAHHLDFKDHCYLPTPNDYAPTLSQLEQGIHFIQQIKDRGGKVYIHCRGGIGRAPTMAAAYLMEQGATLEEAICMIKKSRPFIMIMPLQMQRLREFETIKRMEKQP